MSSEDRDRVIKEWKKRSPDFLRYMNVHTAQGKKPAISPDVASAISVVYLYESSKKIESYSEALTWLTLALVFLTVILAVRTFLP